MTLIRCSECGAEVSDKSAACVKCGAKLPEAKKPTSRAAIFFGGLFAIAVAGAVLSPKNEPPPEKTSVQKLADEKYSAQLAFSTTVAKTLKASMLDPESFVIETFSINESNTLACIEYRSKNGFGGFSRDHASVSNGKSSTSAANWNKLCAGKRGLRDFSLEVKGV